MVSEKEKIVGRFELTPDKFDEISKGKEVVIFDLKKALPDIFEESELIPHILEKVWRRALDDMLSETKGGYAYKKSTKIPVMFHEIPHASGVAKLDMVERALPKFLADVESGKIDLSQSSDAEKKSQLLKQEQGPSDLETLIKEGLQENPSMEVVDMWIARIMQMLISSKQQMPLVKEMIELAVKSDMAYMPLWSKSNEVLMGSLPVIRCSVSSDKYNGGEPIRQDLARLFGSIFQLYSMLGKGMHPLMIIPIKTMNLGHSEFVEFYMTFLKRLSPEVKRNIIFEFKDVPKGNVPPNIKETIENIGSMGRAFMFETSLLTYSDFKRVFPKLYACGFDLSGTPVSESDLMRLAKKFHDHYSKMGLKTYIKSITNPKELTIGTSFDFTYVSGPFIKPPQKAAFSVAKLPLSDFLK